MNNITYINEKRARDLITSEVEVNQKKGFIENPKGFIKHCISTGKIAYDVASKIIKKHPSLISRINPNALRVEGYFHDFSRIFEGYEYHAIGTAYLILTKGRDLGLISGSSELDIEKVLREMASIVLTDHVLYEELGGENFPEGALYKDKINKFMERITFLRKELSKKSNKILNIAELTLPFTLNQQIGLYADFVNLNGKIVSMQKRIVDVIERYSKSKKGYNIKVAELTKIATPRFLVVGNLVKELLK